MKKSTKKLVSLALAIIMLMGLVPLNAGMVAKAAESVTYSFRVPSGDLATAYSAYGTANPNWKYAGGSGGITWGTNSGCLRTTNDDFIAITVKAPNTVGKYKIDMVYGNNVYNIPHAQNAKLWQLPAGTADILGGMTNADYIGSADLTAIVAGANVSVCNVSVNNGYVEITENEKGGEFILVLSGDGKTCGTGKPNSNIGTTGVAFHSITLTHAGEIAPKLSTFTATADSKYIEKVGETAKISVAGTMTDGSAANLSGAVSYTSSDERIATVNENGVVTAVSSGKVTITATATLGRVTKTQDIDIYCCNPLTVEAELSKEAVTVGKTADITLTAFLLGEKVDDLSDAQISYSSSDNAIATVSANGVITASSKGIATITANVTLDKNTYAVQIPVVVGPLKSRSSIYTTEKLAIAQENIAKYSWAEVARNRAASSANTYANRAEEIWELITTQELTRGHWVKNDPNYRICRYCEVDIMTKHGGWNVSPLNMPWKIQCPECETKFPTNDFESYYKLGIDENGNWDPALSASKNAELVAKGEDGYLVNITCPDMPKTWGVDAGEGYKTGNTYSNGVEEIHVYIPLYNTSLWSGLIRTALISLREAYIYTGDEKYGTAGAIILDRVADVYPDMHLKYEWRKYINSDGGSGIGRVVGRIADYNLAVDFANAYDAFWPAMDNPEVIDFLSEKAALYNMKNSKKGANFIRYNCDNGLLREIHKALLDAEILGNYGYPQVTMATAAVVLDNMEGYDPNDPNSTSETKEWIDWIFASGTESNGVAKGNFYSKLVNEVDRDGWGNEASPGYNAVWVNALTSTADVLYGYRDTYSGGNLYDYPKFRRMIFAQSELAIAGRYTPLIGDTGQFAKPLDVAREGVLLSAWRAGVKDDNIARLIYHLYGGDISGLTNGIFAENPEKIRDEIQAVIDEKGEMMDHDSVNLAGMGLMVTRDGKAKSATQSLDTQRSFWMYYGRNSGHGHSGDTLNLDVISYGIDMAPDLGNPDYKTLDCNRITWVETPMAHNTVFVVEKKGQNYSSGVANGIVSGDPYHFDDSGKVKVMDVDAPELYSSTSIFRRTVVSVDATDDVSYAVDFFRVKGGNDHIYNFHAQSEEITIEGATMVPQTDASGNYVGSYAGANVAYGKDELWVDAWTSPLANPVGFTWLKNINRAKNPESATISADFKIKDYFSVLGSTDQNLHLKLTMLNTNNEIGEFAYGDTRPPLANGAPDLIKQIMVRRQGTNLDSLYTAVIQPYKGTPYIAKVEEVAMTVKSGTEGTNDTARAVKVTLTSGRVDYVIYATNKNVTYTVDNKLDFAGFVGVATYNSGATAPSYTYLNDGTKLGAVTGVAAYTGTVVDFTKDMSVNNVITVDIAENYDVNKLAGNYIYIDNGGNKNANYNGAYLIEGAKVNENGKVDLDIGNTTTIRSYVDANDENSGFVYNMAEGQSFSIPLATVSDNDYYAITASDVQIGTKLAFKANLETSVGYTDTLVVALYRENGTMISMTPYNAAETVDVSVDVGDAAYAKAMWWAMDALKPYCDDLIIEISNN